MATLDDTLRRLPKVLLHEHLDGALRPATLFDLARARGLSRPAADATALARWFDERAHVGSLPAYLEGFALTIAAMASPGALERVAFEAAEDARADGCVLAEFRCAPHLWEAQGVAAEDAVAALVAGLRRSALPSGLILCALRHEDPATSARVARLAVAMRDAGVIAFDLAGPEAGHPPSVHAAAFAVARDAGLPITCHAGEADGAYRVLEAARLGARRIGHGVRLVDALGTALFDEVRSLGLHFEVCPTSNVCTGAAASLAHHPIRALWDAGIDLSFHTDGPLMAATDMQREALGLVQVLGFAPADLATMSARAAASSFMPEADRQRALAAVDAWRFQTAGAA